MGIKFMPSLRLAIIVTAHGADGAQFAIDVGLIRTYVADDFFKFRYSIAGCRGLELFGVDDKPFDRELY